MIFREKHLQITYKSCLLFLGLLLCSLSSTAQNVVDEKVLKEYPKSFKNIEQLSKRIRNDFSNKNDQIRALYCWMGHNIKYDVKGLTEKVTYSYSFTTEAQKKEIEHDIFLKIASTTLKERKGVCDGYSKLFKAVCDMLSIECELVEGYSRVYLSDLNRKFDVPDHAWNAVKIDNEWFLVDVTWGAGYLDEKNQFQWDYNTLFFKGSPEVFFKNHYPLDMKWLLINKTIKDFEDQPLYYLTSDTRNLNVYSPLKAAIDVKNGIEIKLDSNIEISDLNYAYNTDTYLQEIVSSVENGILTLRIKPPKKKSKFLTIYQKGTGLITYSILK